MTEMTTCDALLERMRQLEQSLRTVGDACRTSASAIGELGQALHGMAGVAPHEHEHAEPQGDEPPADPDQM